MTFKDIGIIEPILKALEAEGESKNQNITKFNSRRRNKKW